MYNAIRISADATYHAQVWEVLLVRRKPLHAIGETQFLEMRLGQERVVVVRGEAPASEGSEPEGTVVQKRTAIGFERQRIGGVGIVARKAISEDKRFEVDHVLQCAVYDGPVFF